MKTSDMTGSPKKEGYTLDEIIMANVAVLAFILLVGFVGWVNSTL